MLVLLPLPGSVAALAGAGNRAPIGADNRFRALQLIPGSYVVTLDSPRTTGWIIKSLVVNGRDAFGRPAEIATSGANDIVVTITDQITTLTGAVRDASGQIAPSTTVVAFAVDRNLWPAPGVASPRARAAAPDRNGRYVLRGLPPGEYYVAAVAGSGVDLSDPAVLMSLMLTAPRVTLAEGESKSQDVRVTVVR